MRPFVSVVIPCRNEGDSLARCLESVLASRYPRERMEVLIADGMSGEPTRQIARRYAAEDSRVRLIDNPKKITPSALNRALEESRGDYIQRVDVRSELEPGYIAAAVDHLEASARVGQPVWSVGGTQYTVSEGEGHFAPALRVALTHRFGVGNAQYRAGVGPGKLDRPGREPGSGGSHIQELNTSEPNTPEPNTQEPNTQEPGGQEGRPGTLLLEVDAAYNACWPRSVFERIGGFDTRLRRSQDIELSRRIRAAGGRVTLDPAMRTRYWASPRLVPFCRKAWGNGVWAVLPAAYLGYLPVSWRHLVPMAFVASLAGAALAAPVSAPAGVLAVLIVFSYLILSIGCSLQAAWRERDPVLALTAPVAFAALHLSYGAGSWWGAAQAFWTMLCGPGAASAQGNQAIAPGPAPIGPAASAASAGALTGPAMPHRQANPDRISASRRNIVSQVT